jgi:predicted histone-like DNA-binding protein
MSVKYQIIPRKNPQDPMAPEKYYASAIGDGKTGLERLAQLISYQSTVTEADCLAVLVSLEHNITEELQQGRIVSLGRIGNFQVGISSEGKVDPSEVSVHSIIKNRILFRPAKRLRQMLATVNYQKIL